MESPIDSSPRDSEDTPGQEAFWHAVRDVHRYRKAIAAFTVLAAIAAVVVSLLLPNEYKATARVLAPQQPMSSLVGSLGRNISSAARLLGDNAGGDYARYFAILTSPGFLQATADTFRLTQVYELQDSPFPRDATLREVRRRITFELDPEYEYLTINVLDRDPQRSARMANYLVAALNRENSRLSLQTAGEYRSFIERRYREANRAIDSLLDASQAFQEQYGVIDLPAQTQAFFEQAAALRAQTTRLSVEVEAARSQFGPENPQVQSLESALSAAQAEYQRALAGQERSLPVAQSRLPSMVRQYAELERERQMQTAVMEVIGPMYETARLEETKRVEALQVIDPAHVPERKAEPKRAVLVLTATFSAFLLALAGAMLAGAWKRNAPALRHQLMAESSP
ncbi:MAG: lipopolysaccharide biosynthesis protein [Bacteroidetes bacterium]|nr:lipopolysaccharide biosynthesis protein [Bacteroidota bacterium]